MKPMRLAFVALILACAGVLLLRHTDPAPRGDPPTTPLSGTQVVAASPTVTSTAFPPATALLAQALGSSEVLGSVGERGTFRSNNDSVFDGFSFTASVSWQQKSLIDDRSFAKPAYLNKSVGYATEVRRIAAGPWLAQRVHGVWSCERGTAQKNEDLWQSPSFPLQALKMIGQATVNGTSAWDVRGVYTHRFAGQMGRFQIDVFISQKRIVVLKAVETGRVTSNTGKSAYVTGTVKYFGYGERVTAELPAKCKA